MDIPHESDTDGWSAEDGDWFASPSADDQMYVTVTITIPPVYSVQSGGSHMLPDDDPWVARSGEIVIEGKDIPIKGSGSVSENVYSDETVDTGWFYPAGSEPELF